ncbi:Outer membrane protein beta-barrel domain-containing protein [Yoonia rosea]|uniref:Outer membrane protein beta-barrel domain-containing protein n=1 Tax=Yoonia rosea TaxID=287098 RepID=A0A1R3XGV1_9RHOB|nr:outer membrane beta-barrel protein [Yoonia rosea]SIT89403.1 Outer membrane protein beta-barrel domain-containing protein [Yoonia rosea]
MNMTNKRAAIIVAVAALAASTAQADGIYYGGSLGYLQMESTSDGIGETSGESVVVGGLLGYRADIGGGPFWAAELNVDFPVDGEMSYSGGADSCTDFSPDWCDIDALARVRGLYGVPVGGGYDLFGSAGLAIVTGVAEDGGGVYADTVGTGFTAGIGVQRALAGSGTARLEVIYDSIENTDPDDFEKALENVGITASFLF